MAHPYPPCSPSPRRRSPGAETSSGSNGSGSRLWSRCPIGCAGASPAPSHPRGMAEVADAPNVPTDPLPAASPTRRLLLASPRRRHRADHGGRHSDRLRRAAGGVASRSWRSSLPCGNRCSVYPYLSISKVRTSSIVAPARSHAAAWYSKKKNGKVALQRPGCSPQNLDLRPLDVDLDRLHPLDPQAIEDVVQRLCLDLNRTPAWPFVREESALTLVVLRRLRGIKAPPPRRRGAAFRTIVTFRNPFSAQFRANRSANSGTGSIATTRPRLPTCSARTQVCAPTFAPQSTKVSPGDKAKRNRACTAYSQRRSSISVRSIRLPRLTKSRVWLPRTATISSPSSATGPARDDDPNLASSYRKAMIGDQGARPPSSRAAIPLAERDRRHFRHAPRLRFPLGCVHERHRDALRTRRLQRHRVAQPRKLEIVPG